MIPWLPGSAVTGIEARTLSGTFGSCQREKCCTFWGRWLCCTTETKICSGTTSDTQKTYSGEFSPANVKDSVLHGSRCNPGNHLPIMLMPVRQKNYCGIFKNQRFLASLLAYLLNIINKPKLPLLLCNVIRQDIMTNAFYRISVYSIYRTCWLTNYVIKFVKIHPWDNYNPK
jgi:hypothetical protein